MYVSARVDGAVTQGHSDVTQQNTDSFKSIVLS